MDEQDTQAQAQTEAAPVEAPAQDNSNNQLVETVNSLAKQMEAMSEIMSKLQAPQPVQQQQTQPAPQQTPQEQPAPRGLGGSPMMSAVSVANDSVHALSKKLPNYKVIKPDDYKTFDDMVAQIQRNAASYIYSNGNKIV